MATLTKGRHWLDSRGCLRIPNKVEELPHLQKGKAGKWLLLDIGVVTGNGKNRTLARLGFSQTEIFETEP